MPIKPCAVCYTPVKTEPHKPGTPAVLPRCGKHADKPAPKPKKRAAKKAAPANQDTDTTPAVE
jgi:hypothetical protein